MRLPFKTEADAFRVAVALALAGGASVVVGALFTRAYGVVFGAACIAAGITFELAGREGDGRSALGEAAHGPHPRGATGTQRHVLVVASERLAGAELLAALTGDGAATVEVDVLAPLHAPRSHFLASDLDSERSEAQERLEASLAWAAEHGLTARGQVGDPDPLLAIEDELRDFGADEIIIVIHARERENWLARRMLGHLAHQLEVPVREIVLSDAQDDGPLAPGASPE